MAKKIDYTLQNLKLRTSALAVASCLVLSGLPLAVQAAGLGKVTVFSALGQPLRAEVELSASREELSGNLVGPLESGQRPGVATTWPSSKRGFFLRSTMCPRRS